MAVPLRDVTYFENHKHAERALFLHNRATFVLKQAVSELCSQAIFGRSLRRNRGFNGWWCQKVPGWSPLSVSGGFSPPQPLVSVDRRVLEASRKTRSVVVAASYLGSC